MLRRDDPKPGLEVLDGKDVKVNDGAVAALINVLFGTGQPATAVVVPGFRVPALRSVGEEVQADCICIVYPGVCHRGQRCKERP